MPETVAMQITMRLRQIVQEISKHSKQIQDHYDITVPQLICLQAVSAQSPITIGALTRNVFVRNGTVTGIIDRLERRGLVRRTRISRDRRQVHIEITPAGAAFAQDGPQPLHTRFIDRLHHLNAEQVDSILWTLDLLVEMLDAKPSAPGGLSQTEAAHGAEDDVALPYEAQ